MSVDLHDLVAPPPPPDFRDRLWERAEERSRIVARRWRLAAVAATVVAITAMTGASVLALGGNRYSATTTFDETLSCTVPQRGGIPVLDVGAAPTGWFFDGHGNRLPHAGSILIGSASESGTTDFMAVTSARGGYGPLHAPGCTPARQIPLARAGLPLFDTFVAPNPGLGSTGNMNASCFTGSRITARLHATIKKGAAVSAQLAVRSGKKQRPVAFVDWTPKRVTVYFSGDCHD
jgi:hypothetical protein